MSVLIERLNQAGTDLKAERDATARTGVGVGKTRGLLESCEREPSIDDTVHQSTHSEFCFPNLHLADVDRTSLSTNSGLEYPVPSACYGKGKCRKDIDSTKGL
jgi:hypothetical protein